MDVTVQDTLDLIHSAPLPHPQPSLLACFVTAAVEPQLAAEYIHRRHWAEGLEPILADWKYIVECAMIFGNPPPPIDSNTEAAIWRRDGGRCCITGKTGSLWDPLVVVPVLPVPAGWLAKRPNIYDMLDAFFTTSYRDWWLSYIDSPDLTSPYHIHWLVCRSAAKAFAQGRIRLDRIWPSMVEFKVNRVNNLLLDSQNHHPIAVKGQYALLGDHSRSGLEKVDAYFIGTHARLSQSLRWINISWTLVHRSSPYETHHTIDVPAEPRKAKQKHPRGFCTSLMRPLFGAFLTIWMRLPDRVRARAYTAMLGLGKALFGAHGDFPSVQRLPFGLFLELSYEKASARNGCHAMKLVEQHTTVPSPRALDVVDISWEDISSEYESSLHGRESMLLMTRVPGYPLQQCQDILSDEDLQNVAAQLRDYIAQLRRIPNTHPPGVAICNTLGQACRDYAFRGGGPVGPFEDEASFSQVLHDPDEPTRRGHEVVFTHAGLKPDNILVNRQRKADGSIGWGVTGIVD